MAITPIDLYASFLHLRQDGQVHAEQPVFDPERDGWQVMTFHVENDADVHGDHWEIHTAADEVVACLTGGIRLYLRPQQPGDEEEQIKLAAGTAAVVPRGRWHRIALDAPSDTMSVTVPSGSRLEKRTET
ncbi:cupin domain-containing protein [Streptomyces sp. Isolate_219]|uniref:cupin domain-containing protein n=1 Tax=Streptomyces sp. Isolate_219 TaxID=2950110 RepID=UPI0021CA50F4|nr:cupin domain-containing protein [Streptomyces sp. Isolate_219]MCR8578784.1 cupin domain-containing protein [Streptomyces sp. Isolate_219]